jgi:hypothetical protein
LNGRTNVGLAWHGDKLLDRVNRQCGKIDAGGELGELIDMTERYTSDSLDTGGLIAKDGVGFVLIE